MKKNERILLFITIAIGLLAILYSYVIEPCVKPLFVSGVNRATNKKYIEIWNRKDDIRNRSKQIFASDYWKSSSQEQQTAFQELIVNIAKKSGISQIKSITPISNNAHNGAYAEIAIQIDVECPIEPFTKFLNMAGNSEVPIQVRKIQINGETGKPGVLGAQIELSSISIKN
jgi:hypothetical protein